MVIINEDKIPYLFYIYNCIRKMFVLFDLLSLFKCGSRFVDVLKIKAQINFNKINEMMYMK